MITGLFEEKLCYSQRGLRTTKATNNLVKKPRSGVQILLVLVKDPV